MSNLANQLAIAERDEVARAIRLLLARPLLTAGSAPDEFDLVRRRHVPVTKWFDYYLGWSLVVEPRLGYARLAKVGTSADGHRPARRRKSNREPFDRTRYVLMCVVAAELLRTPRTTIGMLAERVVQACAVDPLLPGFDTSSKAERRAFSDALRLLEGTGAVEAVDGATESYVDSNDAKVLYRVDATLLMRLLASPVGASQVGVPAEEAATRFPELLAGLSRERRYGSLERPTSEVQRNLWARHSAFRRVFDDPAAHRDELTEQQLGYLASPTGGQLLRKAAEEAGFQLEERAEGYMLVDPDGLATDSRFPDDSTAKVAALHLLDVLNSASGPVPVAGLATTTAHLLREHPGWAKGYRGPSGPDRLVADALDVLLAFGLARRDGVTVRALPAAARYALGEARTTGSEEDA
ncbi:TIGR02678 family protein [Actinosynnema pretiosum subsp. pretiosum]|uniref:TIGR02678 family protein n=1 Tax=Actinosynnema pretiosum subsp. pretiosum TaxID=103721 RepID=A0AA45LCH3_9PSEU|nr:Hypothetical protein APASM_0921 [Actinosynnema pretiosum subsp. pretiosum]QUF07346.1 TIGR02678 family protein [Actinosynnema pretiosum subsp. pretiosum]